MPRLAWLRPKSRLPDVLPRFPFPIAVVPQTSILIASVANKIEELPVGYIVFVDRKIRHGDLLRFEFIVPAKFSVPSAREPENYNACGNLNHAGNDWGARTLRCRRLRK